MKNVIKLSLILGGFGLLAFLPSECQPQGEGEYEATNYIQSNDVVTDALEIRTI